MSESRRRSPSPASHHHDRAGTAGRDTNSNDPKALRCRLFVGNLSTDKTSKTEIEELFSKYGEIVSLSLHNNFGFIQFFNEKDADRAVEEMHGKSLFGKRIDVNLAGLRRKPQSKDTVEGAPSKEDVVPQGMLKSRPSRGGRGGRDRSPIRGGERDAQYGREAGTLQRPAYEPFNHPSTNRSNMEYRGEGYGAYGSRRDDPREYRYDYRRPFEDSRPLRQTPRPAIDCEIVSLAKELTRYAEEVESRLRSIGLVCNIGYPPAELPIPELMDRIARTGTLYAVVVSEQNSQHRSCTLNILHGTRQEHRNMPLDDALSFMAKNFDSYLRSLREPVGYGAPVSSGYRAPPSHGDNRRAPPPPAAAPAPAPLPQQNPAPPTSASYAANEKQMSTDEIEAMIEKLKKEKEQREASSAKPPTDHERYAELSNQLRESADVPPSSNSYAYANDKYPPPSQASNGTTTSSGYYPPPPPATTQTSQQPTQQQSQRYDQQPPLYR